MKIGDTIKMSVTVDSALSNKKIKLPPQEYKLVAHSKDNNSVALISVDAKQKIIKHNSANAVITAFAELCLVPLTGLEPVRF